MKKPLLLLLALLWACPVLAMEHKTDVLFDRAGNSIVGATVTVFNAGTTTKATIYSNNTGTIQANPFVTAADGSYGFYAANGRYDIVFAKAGYSFTASNTAGIALFDLNEGTEWPAGIRQQFNPTAVIPGMNVGQVAGDPTTVLNGDTWYNSTTNKFRCYQNNVYIDCITTFAGANVAPSSALYLTLTADPILTSEIVVSPTDDTTMIGSGSTWVVTPIPNCLDTAGQHLNYATATNTISCGSSGGGVTGPFSGLTSGTNSTAAMLVGAGASLIPTGSGILAASGFRPALTTVNAGNSPYTATTADALIVCDSTAAARTLNLPAATTKIAYQVKHLGSNTCTITPAGADTVDGVATAVMRNNNSSLTITSDGVSSWLVGG
jgi:hypothetical protein